MYTLTTEQRAMLLDLIVTLHGYKLGYFEFLNQVLFFFEDIPGFEIIPISVASEIVDNLWRKYREQSKNPYTH